MPRGEVVRLFDSKTEYGYVRLLGHGAYGAVYYGQISQNDEEHPQDPQHIAVKEIKLYSDSALKRSSLEKIKALRHPNVLIIHWYDVVEATALDPESLCIAMEYCPGGDLCVMANKGLCWTQIVDYTRQIVKALEYLHPQKIAHMDIKPSNILLTNMHSQGFYMTAKLGDVDNPAFLAGSQTGPDDTLKPGTRRYCSPEMFIKRYRDMSGSVKVGRKTDIWSLGYVVHDLLYCNATCTIHVAVSNGDLGGSTHCVAKSGDIVAHDLMCKRLKVFLGMCLKEDAASRATATDLLASRFLQEGPKLTELLSESQPLWSCGDCALNASNPQWLDRYMACETVRCPISNGRHSASYLYDTIWAEEKATKFKATILADQFMGDPMRLDEDCPGDLATGNGVDGGPLLFGMVAMNLLGHVTGLESVPLRMFPRLRWLELAKLNAGFLWWSLSGASLTRLYIELPKSSILSHLLSLVIPNLTSLGCDVTQLRSVEGNWALQTMPKLASLELIGGARQWGDVRFYCDTVKVLFVNGGGSYTEEFFEHIFMFPNLTSLLVVNWTWSPVSVGLALASPLLASFCALGCRDLWVPGSGPTDSKMTLGVSATCQSPATASELQLMVSKPDYNSKPAENAFEIWHRLKEFTILPVTHPELCVTVPSRKPLISYKWLENLMFRDKLSGNQLMLKEAFESDSNALNENYIQSVGHSLGCSKCCRSGKDELVLRCLETMPDEYMWFRRGSVLY